MSRVVSPQANPFIRPLIGVSMIGRGPPVNLGIFFSSYETVFTVRSVGSVRSLPRRFLRNVVREPGMCNFIGSTFLVPVPTF